MSVPLQAKSDETHDLQCGKRNKVLLVYIDVTYLTIEVAYIYMFNVVLVYTPDLRIEGPRSKVV